MNRNYRHSAFTLIELLTVMAIITLLIGILTPALSTARNQARKTAVRAQINAMEVGLEGFRQDEGKYVPSNANYYASNPSNPDGTELTDWWEVRGSANLQGAHLMLDALVGRDFLGYDPRAPRSASDSYDRWASTNDRRQPYIPIDGVDVTSVDKPPEDAWGAYATLDEVQPQIDNVYCRVFRDKFGWPILYYRASPTANANTPIITLSGWGNTNIGNGVYDGLDNEFFTSYASSQHKIADADQPLSDPGGGNYGASLSNRFAEFIRSVRASSYDTTVSGQPITQPRPVKSDRFIILSAGKDGIYGNLDDVANFDVLSEER